ncbi:hypothetical protein FRD01_19755 [Microvenator marinus]|uniref:Uncharacterized protein n=1 Tax=Microvenator marinus TaxID=2600177 RepID=A0A5B8Y184_9DELT|nr:hypothetical protein [Microvenator marinus]QED29429.1 hypothetical protein FRD01_19755 [Microvenator marinus]
MPLTHYFLGELKFDEQTINPWIGVEWVQRIRKGVGYAALSTPITPSTEYILPSFASAGIRGLVLNSASWKPAEVERTTDVLRGAGVELIGLDEDMGHGFYYTLEAKRPGGIELGHRVPRRSGESYFPATFFDSSRKMGASAVLVVRGVDVDWEYAAQMGLSTRALSVSDVF